MNSQDYIKQPAVTDASIEAYQRKKLRRWPQSPAILPRLRGSIPRVGFHCSFMESDTIRYQLYPALRKRDKSKAELVAYAPAVSTPFYFDAEFITHKMSDEAFCEQVRKDNIDILIELSGFSPGHRFKAMAMRAAPIQVSYLNHTASSHVPNVDYIFADREALPTWSNYSETPYFLDPCFFCFDYHGGFTPDIRPSPDTGFLTFGCFGSITKINPELIALWSRVLHATPRSRMHLLAEAYSKRTVRNRILGMFSDNGIDPKRISLFPGCSRQDVMRAYDRVDVSLDTWPYCGGNTIAESLWMGVPVVTLKGDRFASAYGASLVKQAGFPQLVAHSPAEFVDICSHLDWRWLKDIRPKIRTIGHNLWDSEAYARRLEKAYGDLVPISVAPAMPIPANTIEPPAQRDSVPVDAQQIA